MKSGSFACKQWPTMWRVVRVLLLVLASQGVTAAHRAPPEGECPQPRYTQQAPSELDVRVNPLEANSANRRAGRKLYEDLSDPSCTVCHGKKGDGKGQLAGQFDPPPRNFACADTVLNISDGQLHWVIQNGSAGTAMPPFDYLSEEEIWQLVIYLRSLAGRD